MIVEIRRASAGGISGETEYIGRADLEKSTFQSTRRVVTPIGNGAATPYIEYSVRNLDIVQIGETQYVLQNRGNEDPVVVIKRDENVEFVSHGSEPWRQIDLLPEES